MVNNQTSTPPAPARTDHAATPEEANTMHADNKTAEYWMEAAERNHQQAQTYKRQRDEWQDEARTLNNAARQTANRADIDAAYHRAAGFIAEWGNTARTGTIREKADAAEAISLNLGNLPNFSRAEAIGFAEALLTHFAKRNNLSIYASLTDAELASITD